MAASSPSSDLEQSPLSADFSTVSEKPTQHDRTVLGFAAVCRDVTIMTGLIALVLGVFVFDSNALRMLSAVLYFAGTGVNLFIHRRKARLGLLSGRSARWQGVPHFYFVVPFVWLATTAVLALFIAFAGGAWTIVLGITFFLLFVAALHLTAREPKTLSR